MSPYELKMKLELAEDRAWFIKEHSMSNEMNVIVTDDGHMHFFDDYGNCITKSIKSIKEWEFFNCDSLKSIVIPDSVTSIGKGAFNWCESLTDVVIPDSVTSIGSDAFRFCTSLTSVVIPYSVKSIGEYAFRNCSSLKSISIPDSVESIGEYAFYWCLNLKSIVFKGKTLEEVKSMYYFPWGVEDESTFKVEKAA